MNMSEGKTIFKTPRKTGARNSAAPSKRTTPTKAQRRLQARVDDHARMLEAHARQPGYVTPDTAFRKPGSQK